MPPNWKTTHTTPTVLRLQFFSSHSEVLLLSTEWDPGLQLSNLQLSSTTPGKHTTPASYPRPPDRPTDAPEGIFTMGLFGLTPLIGEALVKRPGLSQIPLHSRGGGFHQLSPPSFHPTPSSASLLLFDGQGPNQKPTPAW